VFYKCQSSLDESKKYLSASLSYNQRERVREGERERERERERRGGYCVCACVCDGDGERERENKIIRWSQDRCEMIYIHPSFIFSPSCKFLAWIYVVLCKYMFCYGVTKKDKYPATLSNQILCQAGSEGDTSTCKDDWKISGNNSVSRSQWREMVVDAMKSDCPNFARTSTNVEWVRAFICQDWCLTIWMITNVLNINECMAQ
jgi:hypothetical protein